ncbi:hypothetical protein [Paenibacillus sinopodophylli]|uniref:hypothetical protein n=1 Tax=Paenibacillus sinopodophylli TaxID=1837342 RepID=UPI00110D07E8|nr:hypothetical protein [Paenibacillus sinopodophylli]
MIYLTAEQETLYKLLAEHPKSSYQQVADLTGWALQGVSVRCRALVIKGAIERKGNQRRFTHSAIEDIKYMVTYDGNPPKTPELPDTLMEHLKDFKVTDQQRRTIKENPNLSRRELAAKLGISKLEVNMLLDRINYKRR